MPTRQPESAKARLRGRPTWPPPPSTTRSRSGAVTSGNRTKRGRARRWLFGQPGYPVRPVTPASTMPAFVRPVAGVIRPIVERLDRLVARLPDAVEMRVRYRLGLDLFVVVAAVVIFLRLFDLNPWSPAVLDMHTYWATGAGVSYNHSNPYEI